MRLSQSISRNFAVSPRTPEHESPAQRHARAFFILNCVLGASALLAAATAVGGGLGSIRAIPGSRAATFSLLGQRFSDPSVNLAAALLMTLVLIAAVVLAVGGRAALAGALASRRFRRRMKARCVACEPDFLVFQDDEVHAFCAGLLRPQIYISTAALTVLSGTELAAVLAHERHHRRRRDPLRIALGRAVARGLFFLPGARLLHERYCALAELAADDFAVRSQAGGSRALASAMLAFATTGQPAEAVGIAPERVEHLMGRPPDWPLPVALVGLGAGIATVTIGASVLLAGAASVRASLALPVLSAKPCIAVLGLIAAAVLWSAAVGMRPSRRSLLVDRVRR
jgi:Zn-dependent protease with chaperone function